MICPNCAAEYEDFHLFCHHCGCALPQPEEPRIIGKALEEDVFPTDGPETLALEELPPEEPEYLPEIYEPAVSAPRGRHWPAVAVMAILTVIGLLLFHLLPMSQPDAPSQNGCFTIDNGVLDFYEMFYTGGSSLIVPETVNGQTVTALADYCFVDCDSLTEIILPETLGTVGDYAFADCSSLRGIQIPDKVTAIGEGAFDYCTALEAVSVPASVTRIGEDAFSHCDKLRHLFYAGSAGQWSKLYSEYINGEVTVYAEDISFSHDG